MFSLVIPTLNEADNIEECIRQVSEALAGYEYEIIVSDDDSPDLTWEVAQKLNHPHVRVLRRTEDKGLSQAVVEAFDVASGEQLGVIDADIQHDTAILPRMIDKLNTVDLVIGSRNAPDGSYGELSLYRRITSWIAAYLAQKLLRIPLSDPMAGYFVLNRDVFERARTTLSPRGFKILLEIYCCARPVKYEEIGFSFSTRSQGESKFSSGVIVEYLQSLIELRRKSRFIDRHNLESVDTNETSNAQNQ